MRPATRPALAFLIATLSCATGAAQSVEARAVEGLDRLPTGERAPLEEAVAGNNPHEALRLLQVSADALEAQRDLDGARFRVQVALKVCARFELSKEQVPLAERHVRLAREIHGGDDHDDVASALNSRSNAYALTDRLDDAVADLKLALAIREAAGTSSPKDLATLIHNLASAHQDLGQYDKAVAHFARAAELHFEGEPKGNLSAVQTLGGWGNSLKALGKLDDSIAVLQRAADVADLLEPRDPAAIGTAYFNLSSTLRGAARLPEALDAAQRATANFGEHYGRQSTPYARALGAEATCLQKLGKLTDAETKNLQALDILEALPSPSVVTVCLARNDLAVIQLRLGKADSAVSTFRTNLQALSAILPEDHAFLITTRNNIASCLSRAGRYSDALAEYRKTLDLRRGAHPQGHADLIQTLLNTGAAASDYGEYADSITLLHEAVEMARRVLPAIHPKTASALNSLGNLYGDLDQPNDALRFCRESLEMRRQLFDGDHPDIARSQSGVALALRDLGRIAECTDLLERTLAMHLRIYGRDHVEVASTLHSLALSYDLLGRREDAVRSLRDEESVRIRAQGPRHPDLVTCRLGLAAFLDAPEQTEEALAMILAAREIADEAVAEDHWWHRDLDHAMGRAHEAAGNDAEAEKWYRSAVRRTQALAQHRDSSFDGSELACARVVTNQGRTDEAIEMLRQVRERNKNAPTARRRLIANHLGDALHKAERFEEAVAVLEEAAALLEDQQALNRGLDVLDQAAFAADLGRADLFKVLSDTYIRSGDMQAGVEALERGRSRALLDLMERSHVDPVDEALRAARSRGDTSEVDKLTDLRDQLAAKTVQIANIEGQIRGLARKNDLSPTERDEAEAEARGRLQAAHHALRELQRQRARMVGAHLPLSQPARLAEIRASLRPGETLLYAVLNKSTSAWFLVQPDTETLARDSALGSTQLEPLIADWREAVAQSGRAAREKPDAQGRGDPIRRTPAASTSAERERELAVRLGHELVPAEIREQLVGSDLVYFVPDGVLHQLPLEALMVAGTDAAPERWVDQLPPVAYVPSGTVLLRARQLRRALPAEALPYEVLAVGDPVFGDADEIQWPEGGALIVRLAPGSQAETQGLEPLDVILEYGGILVQGDKGLRTAKAEVEDAVDAGSRPDSSIAMRIWRRGRVFEVPVTTGNLGVFLAPGTPTEAWAAGHGRDLAPAKYRERSANRDWALPPLPGTRREVEAIATAFGAGREDRIRILLGPQATEPAVFVDAPRARVLHLATHYVIDELENGSFSALALTRPEAATREDDGFLRVVDVLERWRGRLSRCELVVLSACETIQGKQVLDEGMFAMPWALAYAGASLSFVSQWRVDDAATALYMSEFHRTWIEDEDRNYLAAAAAARDAVRKRHPEPWFWAPFVFVGVPR